LHPIFLVSDFLLLSNSVPTCLVIIVFVEIVMLQIVIRKML
jgi:hypothetical protein